MAKPSENIEVSFEFFPPKTDKMNETLWESIKRLEPLSPKFVSVTYGAGGSTRERTHETVVRIKKETNINPAAHLTCISANKDEIKEIALNYYNQGVKHIVALRGDIPEGEELDAQGFKYAVDLVKFLKETADFEISVACYPEKHPEAPSADFDLDNLKRKIDAGATRAISQFFFDIPEFLRFRDRAVKKGIKADIIPGILPVTNFKRTEEFAKKSLVKMPKEMYELFDGLDDDPETRRLIAAAFAVEQCRTLEAEGVRNFHFYTLNRADLTYAICHVLGVRAKK
ncbi:MAG: methylenetetrahydrofolate reductase [Alphaproteobacteria bacterium]